MHHPQLEQCPLFQGLTPEEQAYALSYFDAKTKTYEKGEFLPTTFPSLWNALVWFSPEPFRSIWTTWTDTTSS